MTLNATAVVCVARCVQGRADRHEFRGLPLPDVSEVDRLGPARDHGSGRGTSIGLALSAWRKRQSSPWGERARCADCGSALWFRVTVDGPYSGTVELLIGLFDDANGLDADKRDLHRHQTRQLRFAGDGRNVLTRADCITRFPCWRRCDSSAPAPYLVDPLLHLDYLPGRSGLGVGFFRRGRPQ